MGAEVEINTIPGYLPQRNDRQMGELFGSNVKALFGAGSFDIGGHRTGSTDMGDIAHMKPVIHPYVASALGKTHGADFRINEPEQTRGFPHLSSSICFALWRVCGEFSFARIATFHPLAGPATVPARSLSSARGQSKAVQGRIADPS